VNEVRSGSSSQERTVILFHFLWKRTEFVRLKANEILRAFYRACERVFLPATYMAETVDSLEVDSTFPGRAGIIGGSVNLYETEYDGKQAFLIVLDKGVAQPREKKNFRTND